jgi:hypothetical protein
MCMWLVWRDRAGQGDGERARAPRSPMSQDSSGSEYRAPRETQTLEVTPWPC